MPLVLNNNIWACVQQWHECTSYRVWVYAVLAQAAFRRKQEKAQAQPLWVFLLQKRKNTTTEGHDEVGWVGCKVMETHWMWLLLGFFFNSSLSLSFFSWKWRHSWGWMSRQKRFQVQLDQVLHSYGNMRWAHNSCRAQSDSKDNGCLLCPAFCLAINTALWKKWQRSGLCPAISAEMWAAKYWVASHKIVIHEYSLLLSNAPLITDMTVHWWKIIATGLTVLILPPYHTSLWLPFDSLFIPKKAANMTCKYILNLRRMLGTFWKKVFLNDLYSQHRKRSNV